LAAEEDEDLPMEAAAHEREPHHPVCVVQLGSADPSSPGVRVTSGLRIKPPGGGGWDPPNGGPHPPWVHKGSPFSSPCAGIRAWGCAIPGGALPSRHLLTCAPACGMSNLGALKLLYLKPPSLAWNWFEIGNQTPKCGIWAIFTHATAGTILRTQTGALWSFLGVFLGGKAHNPRAPPPQMQVPTPSLGSGTRRGSAEARFKVLKKSCTAL